MDSNLTYVRAHTDTYTEHPGINNWDSLSRLLESWGGGETPAFLTYLEPVSEFCTCPNNSDRDNALFSPLYGVTEYVTPLSPCFTNGKKIMVEWEDYVTWLELELRVVCPEPPSIHLPPPQYHTKKMWPCTTAQASDDPEWSWDDITWQFPNKTIPSIRKNRSFYMPPSSLQFAFLKGKDSYLLIHSSLSPLPPAWDTHQDPVLWRHAGLTWGSLWEATMYRVQLNLLHVRF